MQIRAPRVVAFTLLGACAFAAWKFEQDRRVAPREPQRVEAKRPHGANLGLSVPERSLPTQPIGALFGEPRAETAPAPAPVPAAEAPMPEVPYRFAGMLREDGRSQFLLAAGDRLFPVRVGETLDGAYRVESIHSNAIRLRYLPLGRDVMVRRPGDATAPAAPAQLAWIAPREVKAGASFSVALHATSVEPVRASSFELRFDPEVIEPLFVQAGRYYEEGNLAHRIGDDGRIEIAASRRTPAAVTNAELFVVRFRALKPSAAAALSVESRDLQAPAGGRIPSTVAPLTLAVRR